MISAPLNDLLVRVSRRAENAPAEVLRDAFVPVPSLLAQLESNEHQVLFGRRGTGKTHLLRHLQDQQSAAGALALYVDLRKVGAAGDVFSTQQDNFAELATGLLIDVVEHMHSQVYEQVLTDQWSPRLDAIGVAMHALGEAATQIRVVGETEVEQHRESSTRATRGSSIELSASPKPGASWKADSVGNGAKRALARRLDRGRETPHVLLGPLAGAFRALALAVHPRQVWLLLDE